MSFKSSGLQAAFCNLLLEDQMEAWKEEQWHRFHLRASATRRERQHIEFLLLQISHTAASPDSSLDAGTCPSEFCISCIRSAKLEVCNFMFPQDDPIFAVCFHAASNCREGLHSSAPLLLAKTFTRQLKQSNSWRRAKHFWGWKKLQVAKWKSPQQRELAPPIPHLPTSLPTHTAKSFRGGISTSHLWHKATALHR